VKPARNLERSAKKVSAARRQSAGIGASTIKETTGRVIEVEAAAAAALAPQ
jgi:hypothetical protein